MTTRAARNCNYVFPVLHQRDGANWASATGQNGAQWIDVTSRVGWGTYRFTAVRAKELD